LNFNNFFNYYIFDLKIIILIINVYKKSIEISYLLLKYFNRFGTWFYHIYNFLSFQPHKIWIYHFDFLKKICFNNHIYFKTKTMFLIKTIMLIKITKRYIDMKNHPYKNKIKMAIFIIFITIIVDRLQLKRESHPSRRWLEVTTSVTLKFHGHFNFTKQLWTIKAMTEVHSWCTYFQTIRWFKTKE
jgi:hypothetical protein